MHSKVISVVFFSIATTFVGAGEFDLSWHTIDSGGVMRSIGGGFELSGTIGQPDTGTLEGDGFQLTGGFWFELMPGDCDEDGLVQLFDHGVFSDCMGGPGNMPLTGCECFDEDGSGAIDLRDFATMSNYFNSSD